MVNQNTNNKADVAKKKCSQNLSPTLPLKNAPMKTNAIETFCVIQINVQKKPTFAATLTRFLTHLEPRHVAAILIQEAPTNCTLPMIPNFTSHQTGRLATYIHTSIMHTPVDTTSYANAGLETLVTDIILGPTTRTYRIYNVYRDQQQHLISSSTTAMMQTLHHITTESTQSNRTTIFAGDTNLHCRSHGIQPTRPLKPLALAEQFDLFVEQTTHITVLNDGSHTRQ